MTNILDATGLHTEALSDIVAGLQTSFKNIYGQDINLDPNSPDAQMINIFAQAKVDMLDCLTQIYNSFSPESAIGVSLDQRCALNGVIRQGATFAQLTANIVTDRGVTLPGLDLYPNSPFTIADASGNQAQLLTTTTFSTSESLWLIGTTYGLGANVVDANGVYWHSLQAGNTGKTPGATGSSAWWALGAQTNAAFQASTAGAVSFSSSGSVVSVTLGVLSVNTIVTVTKGIAEETDAQLRARRLQSVSVPSVGGAQSIYGEVSQVLNVTDALIYENATGSTDANSVTAHTIWCIVQGGTNAAVAQAIYNKRSVGCTMKGSVTQSITATGTNPITIAFDRPLSPALYVRATVAPRYASHILNPSSYYVTAILNGISYKINQAADPSDITVLLKSLDPLLSVLTCTVSSDGITYAADPLATPTIQGIWTLSQANISVTVLTGP